MQLGPAPPHPHPLQDLLYVFSVSSTCPCLSTHLPPSPQPYHHLHLLRLQVPRLQRPFALHCPHFQTEKRAHKVTPLLPLPACLSPLTTLLPLLLSTLPSKGHYPKNESPEKMKAFSWYNKGEASAHDIASRSGLVPSWLLPKS